MDNTIPYQESVQWKPSIWRWKALIILYKFTGWPVHMHRLNRSCAGFLMPSKRSWVSFNWQQFTKEQAYLKLPRAQVSQCSFLPVVAYTIILFTNSPLHCVRQNLLHWYRFISPAISSDIFNSFFGNKNVCDENLNHFGLNWIYKSVHCDNQRGAVEKQCWLISPTGCILFLISSAEFSEFSLGS